MCERLSDVTVVYIFVFDIIAARPSKKKKIGSQATFFQIRWGRQVFFFFFQSNISHMCRTLLKTSLLLFGMLVSSAYGSGNDVLREEVMSTQN